MILYITVIPVFIIIAPIFVSMISRKSDNTITNNNNREHAIFNQFPDRQAIIVVGGRLLIGVWKRFLHPVKQFIHSELITVLMKLPCSIPLLGKDN